LIQINSKQDNDSFDSNKFKAGQRQQWDNVAAGWEKWWKKLEQMSNSVTNRLLEMAEIEGFKRFLVPSL